MAQFPDTDVIANITEDSDGQHLCFWSTDPGIHRPLYVNPLVWYGGFDAAFNHPDRDREADTHVQSPKGPTVTVLSLFALRA